MADSLPPPPPPGPSATAGLPAYPPPPAGVAVPGAVARAPRPKVTVPALLLIGGAVVMIIGTFLPWVTGNGESINGWDLAELQAEGSDAAVFVGLAVILGAFGVALAAAGRVLAVAILAVIVAAFASLAALIDVTDDGGLEMFGLSTGAGLYVILVAALATLAGSVWALATRRR